ncbi:MAG: alcohol dehydrogenase catalytic domain-containing protein [Armatimonadota bacterium]
MRPSRSAYVKSPWLFEVRDNPVENPGLGKMLVSIKACGVCGTDIHTARTAANDWQLFGHEMAGVVESVGESVTRFAPGDRVALNTAAPCGRCEICSPLPYGRARPSQCKNVSTYWGGPQMGFGEFIVTPEECAVKIPDGMSFTVASLAEPMGVSIDLVETGEIGPGDNVLIIGPGPLGLGAINVAKNAGASHIALAGLSKSIARLEAGEALGADEIIRVDKTPLAQYDFGTFSPDKILVTSPPSTLPEAISIAAFGATIAYIGIAGNSDAVISFDADDFHFRRLSLKASYASPDTQTTKSLRLLETCPELAPQLISSMFTLDELADAMTSIRDDDERSVKKVVMISGDDAI